VHLAQTTEGMVTEADLQALTLELAQKSARIIRKEVPACIGPYPPISGWGNQQAYNCIRELFSGHMWEGKMELDRLGFPEGYERATEQHNPIVDEIIEKCVENTLCQ